MGSLLPLLAGIAGLVVIVVLWRLLHRKSKKPWIQTATCPSCGWSGQVSRYAGRCPSCGGALGEQRAKKPR
jgi:predicted Zn-ribbon and HTH transcriptional regulator